MSDTNSSSTLNIYLRYSQFLQSSLFCSISVYKKIKQFYTGLEKQWLTLAVSVNV